MSTPDYPFTPPPVIECVYAPENCLSIGKKVQSSTKVCSACLFRPDMQSSRTPTSSSPETSSSIFETDTPGRWSASQYTDQATSAAESPKFLCAFRDPHFDNVGIFPWRREPGYQPAKNEPCGSVEEKGCVCTNCLLRIRVYWRNRPGEKENLKRQLDHFFKLRYGDDLEWACHRRIGCPFNTEKCSREQVTFVGEEPWPCWNCIHDHPDRLEKGANDNTELLQYVAIVRSHLQGRAESSKPYVCVSQDPKYMFEPWRFKSWTFRIPHLGNTRCLLYTHQQRSLCPVCQKVVKLQSSGLHSHRDNWYEEVFDIVTGRMRR